MAGHNSTPPPSWLIGFSLFPFGLVVGFTITALPFLLTHLGVPLYQVASISAIVMSPTFWGFCLQPLMDTGLTRRAWCLVTALVSALCLAISLPLLAHRELAVATVLLTLGELSIVLYSGAITGWVAEFISDSRRGIVSGWTNVANLGGGALGSLAIMSLLPHLNLHWLGLGLAAVVVASTLPLRFYPAPARSSFHFRQIFTDALRATWKASRTRECLVGFALFLSPASACAAINLFSGMGPDFHASPHLVIWITGLGCALSTSAGALLGGVIADRISRGVLYLASGMGAGVCALVLAFTPHVPWAFILGALIYNGFAGMVYAAFNALGWQLVGHKSPVASTQLGLFSASINGAIVYMTWLDGQGFKFFHLRGLLLTDGLASLAAAGLLFFFLGKSLRRPVAPEPVINAAAG